MLQVRFTGDAIPLMYEAIEEAKISGGIRDTQWREVNGELYFKMPTNEIKAWIELLETLSGYEHIIAELDRLSGADRETREFYPPEEIGENPRKPAWKAYTEVAHSEKSVPWWWDKGLKVGDPGRTHEWHDSDAMWELRGRYDPDEHLITFLPRKRGASMPSWLADALEERFGIGFRTMEFNPEFDTRDTYQKEMDALETQSKVIKPWGRGIGWDVTGTRFSIRGKPGDSTTYELVEKTMSGDEVRGEGKSVPKLAAKARRCIG